MAQMLAGDDEGRDLVRDNDQRSYRASRTDAPVAYRFARIPGTRTHGKSARVPVRVLLRSAIGSLLRFLGPAWDGPARRYRPEDHYMRGPGPKWRAKHFADRASAGRT